jgi:hypothetical protein
MNRETAVRYYYLDNQLRATRSSLARINSALNGNLYTEAYAVFHGITSVAPESEHSRLIAEKQRILEQQRAIKADIERLLEEEQEILSPDEEDLRHELAWAKWARERREEMADYTRDRKRDEQCEKEGL